MQISSTEEYGLRCALVLARAYESEQLSAPQIASIEGISAEYVGKLLHLFKKAGLVEGLRGSRGGFRLLRRPQEVSVKEVFEAVQSRSTRQSQDFCQSHAGQQKSCVHLGECSVRPVWVVLFSYFDQMLEKISLGDLLSSEKDMRKRMDILASQQVGLIEAKVLGVQHA